MGKPSFLLAALLLLIPVSESSLGPRGPGPFHPLCMSQFALASHACGSIPYGPVPHALALSSSASSSLIPIPGFDNLYHSHHHDHHDHRHRHKRRRHHHHHHISLAKKECCRWLRSVDNICICDLLLRLPDFLSRPIHGYKVLVDENCQLNFLCPGRLVSEP